MFEVKQTETYAKWEQGLRDSVARAAITARVVRLANGNLGDTKSVGDGISELRIIMIQGIESISSAGDR
jgi:putative addiction module killer protein